MTHRMASWNSTGIMRIVSPRQEVIPSWSVQLRHEMVNNVLVVPLDGVSWHQPSVGPWLRIKCNALVLIPVENWYKTSNFQYLLRGFFKNRSFMIVKFSVWIPKMNHFSFQRRRKITTDHKTIRLNWEVSKWCCYWMSPSLRIRRAIGYFQWMGSIPGNGKIMLFVSLDWSFNIRNRKYTWWILYS